MYAVRRPVENVYLVRERDRRRTRELFAFALAALPPMAVLFAAIWANLETVRLGYQLENVEKQCAPLTVDEQRLHLAYMCKTYRIMGMPFSEKRDLMEYLKTL